MGAEEICLAKTLILHIFIDISVADTVDNDIALSDSHPRGSPHIQGHSIIALSHELGSLNCFQTVCSTACTDIAVSGYDVKCPDTLVVHV